MKKFAVSLFCAVGFILLGLNYMSDSSYENHAQTEFISSKNQIEKKEVSEDSFEVSKIHLPSIFSALIGLIK